MKNVRKNGFTLIEIIVAMFIFVLVISGSTVVFANVFRSYGDAKDIQENMENAQYAMNLMGKTFRTSSVASGDGEGLDDIVVFDYSQEKCIRYYFDSSSNNLMKAEIETEEFSSCDGTTPSGGVAMTSGDVSGSFNVESSEEDTAVGKITISMTISKGKNTVNLQTTTSLRDYVVSGISL